MTATIAASFNIKLKKPSMLCIFPLGITTSSQEIIINAIGMLKKTNHNVKNYIHIIG